MTPTIIFLSLVISNLAAAGALVAYDRKHSYKSDIFTH